MRVLAKFLPPMYTTFRVTTDDCCFRVLPLFPPLTNLTFSFIFISFSWYCYSAIKRSIHPSVFGKAASGQQNGRLHHRSRAGEAASSSSPSWHPFTVTGHPSSSSHQHHGLAIIIHINCASLRFRNCCAYDTYVSDGLARWIRQQCVRRMARWLDGTDNYAYGTWMDGLMRTIRRKLYKQGLTYSNILAISCIPSVPKLICTKIMIRIQKERDER